MASFPQLFSGSVALYPVTDAVRLPVTVLQFTDFSEQRYQASRSLKAFVLVFDQIEKADKDALQAFFEDRKGGFDSTWDITIGGVLYENMTFETDSFDARENEDSPELWSVTLPVRQIK